MGTLDLVKKDDLMNIRAGSLNSCLMFLGAKREEVYADRRGTGTIYDRYSVEELEYRAHDLYRKACKRHRDNEDMLKELNLAYAKVKEILVHHG